MAGVDDPLQFKKTLTELAVLNARGDVHVRAQNFGTFITMVKIWHQREMEPYMNDIAEMYCDILDIFSRLANDAYKDPSQAYERDEVLQGVAQNIYVDEEALEFKMPVQLIKERQLIEKAAQYSELAAQDYAFSNSPGEDAASAYANVIMEYDRAIGILFPILYKHRVLDPNSLAGVTNMSKLGEKSEEKEKKPSGISMSRLGGNQNGY